MKKLSKIFLAVFAIFASLFQVFAETTATNTGIQGNAQLTDAVRTVYSKEIEFKALPIMRFYQFATIKTELGVTPGLTISMMTYNNLALGGKLLEGVRMTTQNLSSSMKSITVGERGNGITVSELLLQSSFDDIMASATTLLSRDMALVLDCELRDMALSTTNIKFARKSDNTLPANLNAITADCTLKVSTIKDGVEFLSTNNAPKFEGAYYICFVHPHQSRGLRDDSAWIEASKYGAPNQLFNGEIGKIDDVRFIETTLMLNGACAETDPAYDEDLINTGGVKCFESSLFAEGFYGFAVSLPAELRDNGIIDFGRVHELGWYAIWGCALLHPEYGVKLQTA